MLVKITRTHPMWNELFQLGDVIEFDNSNPNNAHAMITSIRNGETYSAILIGGYFDPKRPFADFLEKVTDEEDLHELARTYMEETRPEVTESLDEFLVNDDLNLTPGEKAMGDRILDLWTKFERL